NELASHQLAERGAAGWLVHPLVVDAVRAVCPVDERLAGAAATAVLALLGEPAGSAGPGQADLPQPARVLTGCPLVTVELRLRRLGGVVGHYRGLGGLAPAGPLWDELLAVRPAGTADLLAAGEAALDAGRFDAAGEHARQAESLAATQGDRLAGYQARLLAARALDGAARYEDGAAYWEGWAEPATGRPPDWLPPADREPAPVAPAAGP